MSLARSSAVLVVLAMFAAGCGAETTSATATTTSVLADGSTTASTAPASTSAEPPSSAPTPTSPPMPTSPPAATGLEPPVTTADPRAVVLPVAPKAAITDWVQLSPDCALGTPGAASAMLTAQEGDGRYEKPVNVQQIVVFGDVDAAVAEADRVAAVMGRCPSPQYSTGSVAIGAQGVGLTYGYQPYPDRANEYVFGSHLVVTRRGNALTLTGSVGGEQPPPSAVKTATDLANQAWAALCGYDRTGGC